MSHISYEFTHQRNPSIEQIACVWQALEQYSQQVFFIKWLWIGNWLTVFQPKNYVLVTARNADEVVGLAIFVEHTQMRYGILKSKQLLLHRTGIDAEDKIWIEFNDFLMHQAHEAKLRSQLFAYVCTHLEFDEIVIGASEAVVLKDVAKTAAEFGMSAIDIWHAKSYRVVFDDNISQSVLSSLSSNSRYQINRSKKNYPKLTVEICEDETTFVDWIKDISSIHQQRWDNSGFKFEKFCEFHRQVILAGMNNSAVQIFKIQLSPDEKVYLYNFLSNDNAYFYLSAMTSQNDDNKQRPGLVAHSIAIDYYKSKGLKAYDFMGGDARYKSSFSNQTTELKLMKFQHVRFLLAVEHLLKSLKMRLSKLVKTHD